MYLFFSDVDIGAVIFDAFFQTAGVFSQPLNISSIVDIVGFDLKKDVVFYCLRVATTETSLIFCVSIASWHSLKDITIGMVGHGFYYQASQIRYSVVNGSPLL